MARCPLEKEGREALMRSRRSFFIILILSVGRVLLDDDGLARKQEECHFGGKKTDVQRFLQVRRAFPSYCTLIIGRKLRFVKGI
jgi:hypothetical protein